MIKITRCMRDGSRSILLSSVAVSAALTVPPQFAFAQAAPAAATIAGSVCGVEAGSTGAFGNQGIRWDHNGNGGTSPDAQVDNATLFASASPATPVGISAQINQFDYNLDTTTIPAGQTATDYFEYRFTTADFPELGELNGVQFAGYAATDPGDNQASGAYQLSVQVAEGPVFTNAQTLVSNLQVDDIAFPGADDTTDPQRFSPTTQVAGHYDANGTAIALKPETDYIMRVFFFNPTRSGQDNNSPFQGNVVIWDDFFLKGTNCEAPTAVDDSLENLVAGSVATFDASAMTGILENDSANGPSDIDQATVSLIAAPGTTVTNTVTDGDGDVVGLTIADEGTWAYDDLSGDLTFTPVADLAVDPTPITYTVDDSIDLTSDPATITVDYVTVITAAADTVADVDSTTAQTAVLSLLANDRLAGVAPTNADVSVTLAAGETLPAGLTLNADGTVDVAADTPTGTLSFDYTICELDGNGAPTTNCATATATVSVIGPISTMPDTVTGVDTAADQDGVLNVLSNDDLSGATPTPADVAVTLATGETLPAGFTLNADGTVDVAANTPSGTFTFDYTISELDGNGAPTDNTADGTVSVSVVAPIVANNDVISGVDGAVGAQGVLDIFADNGNGTDTLAGAAASVANTTVNVTDFATPIDNGPVPVLNPATGLVDVPAGTPVGSYQITYQICETDFPGNCDTATIVIGVDSAPVAGDDSVANATIEPVTVNPLTNDSDPDGPLDQTSVVLTGEGAPEGSVLAADGRTLTVEGEGVWTVSDTTGAITFTPEAGLIVDPTPVAYTVDDQDGDTSNTATVAIDYGDVPVANDDVANSDTVEAVTLNPLANDTDADGTLDQTSVVLTGANAPDGSVLAADGLTLTVPDEGVWTVNATTGLVTFTPEADFIGQTTPAAYTVADNDANTSLPATVAINYGEPPVATDDSVAPTAPGPVSIDPLANDSGDVALDPTSVLLTGTDAPAGAVLSADGRALSVPGEGDWSVNPTSGLVTFTPAAGFSGTPTPASYTISDVLGRSSNEAKLSVSVLPPLEIVATNDGPINLNGADGDTSAASLLDNDTLGGAAITDPTAVTLTLTSVPADLTDALTVNADGTLSLAAGTPAGTYTITYEICETANATNCATAQVELVVADAVTDLIPEIAEDLVSILSEDLANTLTTQSAQISSYSADALNRLRGRDTNSCLVRVNELLAVENILFETDRAVILPQSDAILDAIAAILIDCGQDAFEIAGHTDSDASDAYNLDLSQRRAEAVRRALAERGVNTGGYLARGYGESQPVATNATREGKAQNRRVEFRALDAATAYTGPCDDGFSLTRTLNANANEDGITANGQFTRDQHDCITDRRQVFEGSLSYLDTDQGQTQSAINLSYRSEQYRGAESVFGYFAGVYATRSDVTRLATGEINGVGLNGGIYGVNNLRDALFLDYYLGAAAGRHSFDLDFDRDLGTISTSGEYQYFAGFAGAALSGEVTLGDTTLTPRVGIDYVYTPGADVDVVAELGGLSDAGNLDLDAISGGRIFAEVRADQLLQNGASNFWINPRVACYQSIGSLDGACGIGGSIGIESMDEDSDVTYAVELDGEFGEDYTQGSLTVRATRQLDIGTLSGDAGVTQDGSGTLGGTFEVRF